MRYIVFLSSIWLVFVSCTSAPPAEVQVEEDSVQQSDVISPGVQEAATEPEVASADTMAAGGTEEDFPTDEFLPLAEEEGIPLHGGDSSGSPADDGQEYLEEIEIVDLEDSFDGGADLEYGQDEPARILEPEVALVVEAPPESADMEAGEVQVAEESDGVALVVEEVAPSEPIEEAPAVEAMLEENVVLVDSVDEAVPEIVVEEVVEDVEPVEAATTQGVLAPVEPSRSVSMDNRQYLDIRYPGAGWIYLGEVTREGNSVGAPSLTYFGRRRTSEDTSFTLRSTRPGTTILHFYKQDVLSATFIDDFLEVTISEEVAELGSRIVAPDYGSIVPAYQDAIPQVLAHSDEAEESSLAEQAESDMPSVPPMDSAEEQSQDIIPMDQGMVDSGNPAAPAQEVLPEQPVSDIAAVPDGAEGEVATLEPMTPDEAVPQPDAASREEETESFQIEPEREQLSQEEELAQVESAGEQFESPVFEGESELSTALPSQELDQQQESDVPPDVALLLPQVTDQDALLAQAQEYFYAEDFSASLETLDKFFTVATGSFDAAYYLKGQVLESNSSVRNIREAQKAYKHVIDSYPQSPFWERAKKRHTYLSRLYFEIR